MLQQESHLALGGVGYMDKTAPTLLNGSMISRKYKLVYSIT